VLHRSLLEIKGRGENPYKRAKTLRLASRNNSTDRAAIVNSVRYRLLVFASLIALKDKEMADRRQGQLVVKDSVVVPAANPGTPDLHHD
jgi:hypothetical protein